MNDFDIKTDGPIEPSPRKARRMRIGLACLALGGVLFGAGNYYATKLYRIEEYRTPFLSGIMGICLYAGIALALMGCAFLLASQKTPRRPH